MRIGRLLLALWAALLLAGLAQAQESGAAAAAAPAPSAEAEKAMWCGAAFSIAGARAKAAGDEATATVYAEKSAAAFGAAAGELITNGMTVEQFRALAEKTAAAVTAPFRSTSYGEAECEAVLPD